MISEARELFSSQHPEAAVLVRQLKGEKIVPGSKVENGRMLNGKVSELMSKLGYRA